MMVDMRHTGKSGKFAVICGIVAAGLLVLTAMTLAEPVFLAFLGVLALAYLAAVAEILVRRRRFALLAAGAGTALALGFSLAFLSTWELAFDGQSSFLGTPLPTDDPDNYFIAAASALAATFGILFLGALWPGRRRIAAVRRPLGVAQGEVWVLPVNSPSAGRQISTDPTYDNFDPQWSADSQALLWSRVLPESNRFSVWYQRVDSVTPTMVADDALWPRWIDE